MNPLFEELDFHNTPMGELVLRRRRVMALKGKIIYEVKLNDEYLMSSLFYAAEAALAETGLARLEGGGWDVAVGGLGLGYTAAAALEFEQVKRLVVIEALEPVIDWHRQNLVPNGAVRCFPRQPRSPAFSDIFPQSWKPAHPDAKNYLSVANTCQPSLLPAFSLSFC
ncbi:MAG: hypothetical protein R6U41_01745 [Desulfosalsimonas sp.]|uniref:hypothetical protein n=1 Tax=Desulfosalsimonas sp. TaxID=3073848 RepID=UPI0039710E4F